MVSRPRIRSLTILFMSSAPLPNTGRIAIIAALKREILPLVGKWVARDCETHGRKFRFYESPRAIAVAGGIGKNSAALAARAAIERYSPALVLSVGLAGALVPNL